jgi:hypothetical protein
MLCKLWFDQPLSALKMPSPCCFNSTSPKAKKSALQIGQGKYSRLNKLTMLLPMPMRRCWFLKNCGV